jgi:hypothetical protein
MVIIKKKINFKLWWSLMKKEINFDLWFSLNENPDFEGWGDHFQGKTMMSCGFHWKRKSICWAVVIIATEKYFELWWSLKKEINFNLWFWVKKKINFELWWSLRQAWTLRCGDHWKKIKLEVWCSLKECINSELWWSFTQKINDELWWSLRNKSILSCDDHYKRESILSMVKWIFSWSFHSKRK